MGNLTYALPNFGGAGSGLLATLGSAWQISGLVLLESGAPFTVNIGTDGANIGAGPAQRPNQTCDPNQGGAQTAAKWFNTACFALQPQFTFGNAPRNSVVSPGYAGVDISVSEGRDPWPRNTPAISMGGVQPAESREFRRAEPRRLHTQLRTDL